MTGMAPEWLAEIRGRVAAEEWRWDHYDDIEADRANLLAEVERLRAGIQEQIDRSDVAAEAWDSGTEHVICTVHATELRHLLDPTGPWEPES